MKYIYLKVIVFLIIAFVQVNICLGQIYDPLTNDSIKSPKSIPEQLEIVALNDTIVNNSYFNVNNFEIRIWKNDPFIDKIKLWQIQKISDKYFFSEYDYFITAMYYHLGEIVYDSYDSTLWRRLPVIGGNGVIGFLVSELKIIEKNELAETIYNKLVDNNIFQLYTFDFQVIDGTIELDGVEIENIIPFGYLFSSSYTVEIASDDFYLKYNFVVPENIEDYTDKSKGLFFANEIFKILN